MWWWRRRRALKGLDEDIRDHIARETEEHVARGLTAEEARRRALVKFGNVALVGEDTRAVWAWIWLQHAVRDARYALRVYRRNPVFAAVAVLSLAFAVGATLAVFTVVNALWLKPLPFPEPDRVVMLVWENHGAGDGYGFSNLEAPTGDWTMFEAVAGQASTSGYRSGQRPRLRFADVGREVETVGVTSGYFGVLGLPVRGRDFTRDDNLPGAEPVAIISDRFWSRAFARRSEAIGAVVAAAPLAIRIIGVAPAGFQGARHGEQTDVWIPTSLVPRLSPAGDTPSALALARLHPGQTPAEAQRQFVQAATTEGERLYREPLRVVRLADVFGTPESRSIVIREGRATSVVAGLAGLVLLAGCVTLMSLVLVHYERRRRELSVRRAIGASRWRLVAQLSRELAWLAALGTAGAVLVAAWSLRALPALSLPGGVDLSRLDLSLDWRVLSAGIAATTLTLVLAALVPIRRFTRGDVASELAASGSTTPRSSQRLRQGLLTAHVAATIVVLVSAGLFVRAVIHGFSAGSGIEVDRTLFLRVELPRLATVGLDIETIRADVAERTQRMQAALRALPGVDDVAIGTIGLPPIGPDELEYLLAKKTVETSGERRDLHVGTVRGSAGVLSALGVPILAGRPLTDADRPVRPTPSIVTAGLARNLWPTADPLGQVLAVGPPGGRGGRYTVVGVASDFAYGSLRQQSAGVVITVEEVGRFHSWVVRAQRPDLLVAQVRRVVEGVIPGAPHLEIATGRDVIARDLGPQRLGAWFFSGFGLIALVLGAGGVFGLVAYLGESRRREFGVRLALGATPGDLVRFGIAAGLGPVTAGATIGVIVAAFVARLFVSALPGLSVLDPLTYAAVALLMFACAAAAGVTGAWRFRRIGPSEALRAE